MEATRAVSALSALAHEGRLATVRMLVQAGRDGVPAGEIARRLGVPANSLSANLTILAHAGLVTSRREGRSIIYLAAYDRLGDLLVHLMEDCCAGRPEICTPLAQAATRAACCDQPQGARHEPPASPRLRRRPAQVDRLLLHPVRGRASGREA